jgi:hypothetical protein
MTTGYFSFFGIRMTYSRFPQTPWFFFVLFGILSSVPLSASEPIIARRASAPPVIDGKLDDPCWAEALKLTDFRTWQPDFGKVPSQKTEAYFLYDPENFYFGIRCYDNEPGKIKAAISKRDNIFQHDYAAVCIDTFSDYQNAYAFLVNPLGIQGDGLLNSQGNLEPTLDLVWYSKGQIDDQGYTVELRVPLESLRFPGQKTVVMGIFFFRQLVRTSEMASVPPYHPEKGSVLVQAQPISITGLKYHRVVEILPAFTHTNHSSISDGRLRRDLRRTDFSLTTKVGITSDLTSDATYNPDFSQVESDAGQVDFNIRYALYYPEKRPFFLEGLEYFQFAGNTEDAPLVAVVYTRSLIDPIVGLKATGKLGNRNTIAAIYARDDLPGDPAGRYPNFGIVRFKHSFRDDSYLGGFYTSRFQGSGFNQVGGSDGRLRLSSKSFAEFHLFGSVTKKPGQGTPADGHALGLRYLYNTRKVSLDIGYQDVSKYFQVDSGFVLRNGIGRLAPFVMYMFYPKSKFFQRIEPFYWGEHIYDKFYKTYESINFFVLRFQLPRMTMFRIDGILGNEVYVGQTFNRSGFGCGLQSQLTKQIFLEGRVRRRRLIFYDPAAPYEGYGNEVMLDLTYQPVEKLEFGLSYIYTDFFRKSDRTRVYNYGIIRSRNIFQVNKYLFLRAIFEYNTFRDRFTADGLISFTYIPGTVIFVGYGSAYEKLEWSGSEYIASRRFLETQRGFFFKVSYLWRW